MTPRTYDLTAFQPSHVAAAHRLSQAEQWPHRPEDWRMLAALSRGVALLDGNILVATALACDFGPVATAAMIVVDRRHRGRGLGRRVMEAALAELPERPDRTLRLIATEAGLPLYRKMGFAEYGQVSQHQGIVRTENKGLTLPERADVSMLDEIATLDHAGTGMDRRRMLQEILRHGKVVVTRAHGRLTGYAALRPFGHGEVIGPVIAPSETEAKALIAQILGPLRGRYVRLDVPAEGGLPAWLTDQGLPEAGRGVCMQRGAPPSTQRPPCIHALASQALG